MLQFQEFGNFAPRYQMDSGGILELRARHGIPSCQTSIEKKIARCVCQHNSVKKNTIKILATV